MSYNPCWLMSYRLESGSLKQETVINPFEKKVVAKLTLQNPRGAWGLRCRYKWLEGDPDRAVIEAMVEKDMSTIGRLVEAAQTMDFGADSALIHDLEKKCAVRDPGRVGSAEHPWKVGGALTCYGLRVTQKADINFVDVEFPPSKESIVSGGKQEETKGAEASDGVHEKVVTWRRPVDFFDGEYDIFLHSGGDPDKAIEPRDIRQGGLGDCW